jgi:hypothetical protein
MSDRMSNNIKNTSLRERIDAILMEHVNLQQLYVLDETVSLFAVLAPLSVAVLVSISRLWTNVIFVVYNVLTLVLWFGYKIAKIKLSITLRLFVLMIAYEMLAVLPFAVLFLFAPPLASMLSNFLYPRNVALQLQVEITILLSIIILALFLWMRISGWTSEKGKEKWRLMEQEYDTSGMDFRQQGLIRGKSSYLEKGAMFASHPAQLFGIGLFFSLVFTILLMVIFPNIIILFIVLFLFILSLNIAVTVRNYQSRKEGLNSVIDRIEKLELKLSEIEE